MCEGQVLTNFKNFRFPGFIFPKGNFPNWAVSSFENLSSATHPTVYPRYLCGPTTEDGDRELKVTLRFGACSRVIDVEIWNTCRYSISEARIKFLLEPRGATDDRYCRGLIRAIRQPVPR